VHVNSGPDGQVTITENRSGMTDAITTSYHQQGDAIAVTVAIESGLPLDTWVDFVVQVPRASGATVAVAAGTLEADGLRGSITLQDTNGSIWVTHLRGTIALQTQSGSINAEGVTGQVQALTQNGTITTTATRLSGRSLMQAESGTINFHGSFDPTCAAVFRNTNGAVGVTLPRGASAHVDAHTPQGAINSSFTTIKVVSGAGGQVASGSVGKAPWGRLNIQTTNGSIGLSQEP
jgi:DUF4097 and DUF4098 domain-containing protein YvlB